MTIDVPKGLWSERLSERKTQNQYLDARRTFRTPFVRSENRGSRFSEGVAGEPSDPFLLITMINGDYEVESDPRLVSGRSQKKCACCTFLSAGRPAYVGLNAARQIGRRL